MNERIKELIKQSETPKIPFTIDRRFFQSAVTCSGELIYTMHESELIKFAELIIKECAMTVQDFVDHRFPASEYPDRLKRYFGVEE